MAKKSKPVRRRRRALVDGPHPVDVHVGSRIRMRRTLLGMSQTSLGEKLGLTFQQVQKYESGANRVSSSRLYEMSKLFDVPVSFFFEEMTPETAAVPPLTFPAKGLTETPDTDDLDPLAKSETLELVRAYYQITDSRVRKSVFDLAKTLGKTVRGG